MSAFRKAFFFSCCAGLIVSVLLLPEGVFNTVCGYTSSVCTSPKIRLPSPMNENSRSTNEEIRGSNVSSTFIPSEKQFISQWRKNGTSLKLTFHRFNHSHKMSPIKPTVPPGLLHPASIHCHSPTNESSGGTSVPLLENDNVVEELMSLIVCLTQLPSGSAHDMLLQALATAKEDLRPILRELQTFRSRFACRSCTDERPPPVTELSPNTRLSHNATWRGVKMPIITVTPEGRLGNLMSEYASLFALKQIYGASAVLTGGHSFELSSAFTGITIPTAAKAIKPAVSSHHWTQVRPHAVGQTTSYAAMQLAAAGLLGPRVFRGGGFPSEVQLFAAYREQLRREFACRARLESKARKTLLFVPGTNKSSTRPVLVGVHVRLGDYITYMRRKFNVKHLSYEKYLRRAVAYFTMAHKNVMFVVTSDDIINTKKLLRKIGVNNSYISSGSAYEDMCLLSKCDHNIITLGTFGFWTGFLGRGTTVYPDLRLPKRQYFHSRPLYERAKLDDFIPIPF